MDRITQIISAASATAPPGEIKELLESIARLLKAIARSIERKSDRPYRNNEEED
ncbi:MAG: hypothetical protein F6K35_34435 [Okeania sp. SIO2H7]|nr:hypothetical protein [Okeania sp. SIO2H7]